MVSTPVLSEFNNSVKSIVGSGENSSKKKSKHVRFRDPIDDNFLEAETKGLKKRSITNNIEKSNYLVFSGSPTKIEKTDFNDDVLILDDGNQFNNIKRSEINSEQKPNGSEFSKCDFDDRSLVDLAKNLYNSKFNTNPKNNQLSIEKIKNLLETWFKYKNSFLKIQKMNILKASRKAARMVGLSYSTIKTSQRILAIRRIFH